MKFRLEKASDWGFEKEVEINTLEELMALVEEYGEDLVINKERIIIYDDYLE